VVLDVHAAGDKVAGVGVGLLGLHLLGLDHVHLALAQRQHRVHRGLHLLGRYMKEGAAGEQVRKCASQKKIGSEWVIAESSLQPASRKQ
jgi:hypothetical protein